MFYAIGFRPWFSRFRRGGATITEFFAGGAFDRRKEPELLRRFIRFIRRLVRGRKRSDRSRGRARDGFGRGTGEVPLALVVPRVRRRNIARTGGGEGGVGPVGVKGRLYRHGAAGAPHSGRRQLPWIYAGRVCLQQQRFQHSAQCANTNVRQILRNVHENIITRKLNSFFFDRPV